MIDTTVITAAVNSGLGKYMSLLYHSQIVNSQMWSWIAQSILIQTVSYGKSAREFFRILEICFDRVLVQPLKTTNTQLFKV